MILRWLISKTVRETVELRSQVRKILNAQRDELPAQGIDAINAADAALSDVLSTAPPDVLRQKAKELEQAANKWLRPYPSPAIRENIEMFVVVSAVVIAIRTFFFQPMAIPSGSAQPTLYGITHEDLRGRPASAVPGALSRFYEYWVHGVQFVRVVAEEDGELRGVEDPKTVFPFVKRQRILVGSRWYSVWFPPEKLVEWSEFFPGKTFKRGEDIVNMKVIAGDHLFVNRLTYNFRQPTRGEIIVFFSTGIPRLTQDTHYIKRLIALGGERVRIGDDRHVVINDTRLDASTPHFENLYSFHGDPADSKYSGHVNEAVARKYTRVPLADLFPNEKTVFQVRPHHLLTFGDNTMNSFDSRSWGDFPEEKVIGKAGFVFWPISDRFGWGAN